MIKVFISHSSKDKSIVSLFKDIILKTGIGLCDENIFFTSTPETGVPIGENIPEYIKRNLMDCDYVFLMISENYKKSEVCLNEMGAAIVIDKKIFPILLYNYTFDKVGWLIDRTLCIRIDDADRLDEIRDIFNSDGITTKTSNWIRSRNDFLDKLSLVEEKTEDIMVKGLLDYQLEMKENQDKHNEYLKKLNDVISNKVFEIQNLIKKHNESLDIHVCKEILENLAISLNKWAEDMDSIVPVICLSLANSLKSLENFLELKTVSPKEKMILLKDVSDFQDLCRENKKVLVYSRKEIEAQADMVKSQILAKNRLLKVYDSLLNTYDMSIKKISDIINSHTRYLL